MGGSTQTSKQTTNTGPWPPAQKYLRGAMEKAAALAQNKKGFNPYPGQTWTPFSSQTQQGLNQIQNLAGKPNPLYAGSNAFAQGLIGGNYDLDQSGYQNLMGQDPNAIAQYGTGIASGAEGLDALSRYGSGIASGAQNQNALSQYGSGIASGAEGIGTEGDFRSMYDQVNPLFEGVVNRQAGQIGDDVSRQFGGASFGSAASTGALVDQIGDFRNKMQSENFFNQQNLKRGLLGDITGVQGQNIANRLGAAGALSGEQGANLARQLQAAGQLSGEQGQNIANRLGAAGALSGEQQQGFANQFGLNQAMSGLSQQDIANRMGGVGMADQVYQSQFLPAERMLGVGAAREAKAGEQLQSLMDRYDTRQQAPWNRLGAAYPYFAGTGGQTQTVTQEQPTDPWGRILGGGLLASQMFNPMRMFGGG